MSEEEFNEAVTTFGAEYRSLLIPRPGNLLDVLTMAYGGDVEKITAWLDDPNTEVDEYLIHWTLTPVIARLDVYRRSASLVGKTFAELCAETRALAESGVIPPRVRSFLVPAGASLATRPTGDPGQ
ncbi:MULTISPECIES: hypothetical protein [Rhodococcus]|jgi:hypothetical protein|uniref:Uncharacterized protein n=1 Tax=Rhodococcus erythropolis (strain PR4 / NBRC 100887) TaxID=234621 RepID=C0ZVG7_RHOE4|nr:MULTISPECIES: hypothetical protein [Rhodococcus]MBW0287345.1 hypothetical protein [Rhodococcus sp. FH8]MCW0194713.1 hypothetical protein [Rhodococcus sp. (in: high G+C Gram-positive bacteria)]QSE41194.1 hypothetical protein JXX30_28555 [Rhodococcus erythropolis]BAH36661.1 hypothetical protein RER_59530 [Rhodococcus erythropolis PR4]